jgi:transposase
MSYKIAGIDVPKKVLMVVVMDASTPDEKPERRRFATLPSELHRLSIWLREQGVEEAVMESTAQYWRSVWLELERLRASLAPARPPRSKESELRRKEQQH